MWNNPLAQSETCLLITQAPMTPYPKILDPYQNFHSFLRFEAQAGHKHAKKYTVLNVRESRIMVALYMRIKPCCYKKIFIVRKSQGTKVASVE